MNRQAGLFGTETQRRSRTDSAADLDITPMIDVTFLLLIFFMVTSTMQATPDIPLPVAYHGLGIDRNDQVTVSVLVNDGRPVLMAGDPPAPELSLEEIVAYARDEIATGKTGILIKASGEIPTGYLKQVTQQLQTAGEVTFYYAVSEQE